MLVYGVLRTSSQNVMLLCYYTVGDVISLCHSVIVYTEYIVNLYMYTYYFICWGFYICKFNNLHKCTSSIQRHGLCTHTVLYST